MKIKVDGHAWNGFEIRFFKKFWMDGISKIGFLRLRMVFIFGRNWVWI